jgi:Ca2+-binding RTX toxin-like protein
MAFITAETRSDLIALSVGMLKQAPSNALLEELIALSVDGGTLADAADHIAKTDAFKAEYPSFQTASQYAAEIFDNITTGGTVTAEIRTAVIDLATGYLTSGAYSKAGLALAIVDFLSQPAALLNSDFADIAQSVQNRSAAAEYFVVTKELGGSTDAELAAAVASVTSDAATLTAANAAADATADAEEVVAGQTFTLTTGVDTGSAFTGGAGDDTFIATAVAAGKETITSGDSLSGGEGTDTLALTSAVAGTYGNGVIGSSIEALRVTATAATVVDASLMTDVTDVYNVGSTAAGTLSVTGAAGIPNVHLNGSNSNTSVTFANANVNGGAADSTTVALASSGTIANTSVTLNGVETINVATSGSMSGKADSIVAGAVVAGTAVTIASDTLKTLSVTGDSGARIVADLVGATATVQGTITSGAAGDDISFNAVGTDLVSVDMGAGNDTVRLQTAPGLLTGSTTTGAQTIVGGEGTDTLVTGVAISKLTNTGISGFETLQVTNNSTVVLDAAKNDISRLVVDGTGATVTGVEAGATIDLTTAGSVTLDKTTTGAISVNVGNSSLAGVQTSSVTAAGVTSATINSLAIATDSTSARSVGVAGAALTEMTVTGSQPTTITGGGAALAKIDASGITKDVTFSATLKATGAELIGGAGNDTATGSAGADTITGGAGNDALTGGAGNDVISGGDGVDTITGGTGKDTMTGGAGADTFVFSANATTATPAVNVSTLSAADTITDFTSGTDKLSGTQAVAFLGNFTNIQAALAANNVAGVQALSAAYVTGEENLYVFEAAGNALSADDLVINLPGVATLAAGDLMLGAQGTGNTTVLSATAATATNTTATRATLVTTTKDDTISATVGFAEDSTIDGGAGYDTLALSIPATTGTDDGTVDADDLDTITNVEKITLANRAASVANGNVDYNITLAHEMVDVGDTLTIVSSEDGVNADGSMATAGVTLTAAEFTNGNVGGAAMLHYTGAGAQDVITGGDYNDTILGGDGNDVLTGGSGNDYIDGGAGNDLLHLGATASGVTTVISGGAGSADVLRLTGGAVTFDLTDVVQSGIETINLEEGVGAAQVLVLDAGNLSGVSTIAFDADAGGGTADTLQLENGTYNFSSIALTFATAASVLDLNTQGNTAKTITVDAADIANVATITGESTASIVTTINLNGTDDLRAATITNVDVLTLGGTTTSLTLSGNDFTSSNFTTVTGTGTTNTLVIGVGDNDDGAVGDGDDLVGNVDLTNTTISGMTSIDVTLGATTNDLILDAASISGNVTLIGAAGTDLQLAENGDYTNLTLTAEDFDSLAIASAVTAVTVSENLFDGAIVAIDDAGATADPTVTIVLSGAATLDLSAVAVGGTNGADIVVTGSSGNDIIYAAETTASGSSFTITTGAGTDVVRLEEASGNTAVADAGATVTIADSIRVTDFDATKDQVQYDISDTDGASLTVGTAATGSLNIDTGAGFTLITGAAVNDFSSAAAVAGAIGNMTGTDNDEFVVAIQNASGTQVGIYNILLAGANTAAPILVGTDGITLIAVLDVTGTFGLTNMGVY